jgi:type I restriction enzyme S subunit
MEVKVGYKQTEVGIIPEDWKIISARDACSKIQDGTHFSPKNSGNEFLYVTSKNIRFGYLDLSTASWIDKAQHEAIYKRCDVKKGDLLLTKDGANTGNAALNNIDEEFSLLSSVAFLRFNPSKYCAAYFLQQVLSSQGQNQIKEAMSGNAITRLTLEKINKLKFTVPPTLAEQEAIAEALSDADALIEAIEQLIAKKRQIKQGAMSELLTPPSAAGQAGKRRLVGFSGEWETKSLEELINCLDNLRVPLNETHRMKMQGDYPYCGANGVLGYVDSYVIDDDFILIAEDGGYFDEYATRPIAYKMSGKCWVNNHAHILKAKENINQDFIYYSLVHKNILSFLASGTRAKLNKSEMYKIQINIPSQQEEQTAIAEILSDMDAEISALEEKLSKARQVKAGMMSVLLTGKIRLVSK